MTIKMVPVKLLSTSVTPIGPGRYAATLGANAVIQYNTDNLGAVYSDPTATPVAGVYRTLLAASSSGIVDIDGFGVRLLCSGTAATSYFSRYKNTSPAGLATPGNTFLAEANTAGVPITASGGVPSAGISTITATAHGLAVGDVVTFSGSAAWNDINFQVLTVPTSGTFTIATGTLAQLA